MEGKKIESNNCVIFNLIKGRSSGTIYFEITTLLIDFQKIAEWKVFTADMVLCSYKIDDCIKNQIFCSFKKPCFLHRKVVTVGIVENM